MAKFVHSISTSAVEPQSLFYGLTLPHRVSGGTVWSFCINLIGMGGVKLHSVNQLEKHRSLLCHSQRVEYEYVYSISYRGR